MTTPDEHDGRVPNASELLDFEPIAKSASDKGVGLLVWIGLAVALSAGAGAVWFYLQGSMGEGVTSGGIPVILATGQPYKVKPDSPGGMDVPDRDKLVYGRIDGSAPDGPPEVERLLPPPESPVTPPQAPIAPAEATLPAVAPEPAPEPAPKVVAPPARPMSLDAPAPAPIAAPKPAPEPKVQPAPAPAPAPAATPAASGGYLVQLSALKSEASAQSEWKRLKKAQSDLLGSLNPVIVRADLGAKGVYWRLRAGSFKDRAAAKAMCAKLAARKVGCLIVSP